LKWPSAEISLYVVLVLEPFAPATALPKFVCLFTVKILPVTPKMGVVGTAVLKYYKIIRKARQHRQGLAPFFKKYN